VTKFRARSLGVLDKVYDFDGGTRGLSEFDLEGAIQPVHDLSREAELGSGHGRNHGFYIMRIVNTHVGVGSITDQLNIFTPTNRFGTYTPVDPSSEWIWGFNAWMEADEATDFASATLHLNAGTGGSRDSLLGAFEPAGAGAGTDPPGIRLIAFWNAIVGASPPDLGNRSNTIMPSYNIRPFPIPFAQAVLTFVSTSDTAGTIEIAMSMLIWRGPRGVTPPGIA